MDFPVQAEKDLGVQPASQVPGRRQLHVEVGKAAGVLHRVRSVMQRDALSHGRQRRADGGDKRPCPQAQARPDEALR